MFAQHRRGAVELVTPPHRSARDTVLAGLASAGPLLRAASDAIDGPTPADGVAALVALRDALTVLLG